MKKNLLIAALVLPLLSVYAQWNQVGGTVSVKPGTLKYVEQNYAVTGGQTSNEGNVNVRGAYNVGSAATFTNEWNNATSYGQLIINENSSATGIVNGEFRNTNVGQFVKQPLAVPYTQVTAEQLRLQAGIPSQFWLDHPRDGVFNPNKWKNPINTWLNADYALETMIPTDVIETGSLTMSPANYYSINQLVDNLEIRLSTYFGTPANGLHPLRLTPYTISPGTESVVNNYSRNIYGEMLGTYLKDAFVAAPTGWAQAGRKAKPAGFGENLFYFGNPYTSNIDLTSVLPVDGSIVGVWQFNSNDFDPNTNSGNGNLVPGTPTISTRIGAGWTGDGVALLLRPFHTFALKTNGVDQTINLGETVKTFDIAANAPSYVDRATNNGLQQLKLELSSNDILTARTYIVAAPDFEAAAQAGNEAYADFGNDVNAIFTLQENADGTINEERSSNQTYINGINETSYVALPVHLVHQVAESGDFSLTGVLSEGVLNSGNKFYFEDVQENFIAEITPDFVYNFSASETSTDRFRIYWNGLPEVLNVADVAVSNTTVVYKNIQKDFYVRFADSWNKADVFVYNMMGQLVHSAKNVNAANDYYIPLKGGAAAYVVKTVSENGEVATQKIVKQ